MQNERVVVGGDYWCFISYRHADNKEEGRQWATWLHQAIETYEVPEDLVGTVNDRGDTIPERIFPVFRDEDELPADADLASPIYRALDRSRFLIVLCSPRAVASTYVNHEIRYFKQIGRADRVLAAIIEGEPNASWDKGKQAAGILPEQECFPQALQHPVNAEGELIESERAEPIAADFRLDGSMAQGWTTPEAYRRALLAEGSRGLDERVARYRRQCELAKLKIIAGVLGIPLGQLTKRDAAYQLEKERRRMRIFRRVAAALVVLAGLALAGAGVAWWQRGVAEEARELAEESRNDAVQQKTLAEKARDEANRRLATTNYIHGISEFDVNNRVEGIAYQAAGLRIDGSVLGAYKKLFTEVNGRSFAIEWGEPVSTGETPYGMQFSSDDRLLLVRTAASKIHVFNVATRKEHIPPIRFDEGERVDNATFDSSGDWIGAEMWGGGIMIRSTSTGDALKESDARYSGIREDIIARFRTTPQTYFGNEVWNSDGTYRFQEQDPIIVQDASGRKVSEIPPLDSVVMKLQVSSDGRHVAATSRFEDTEVHDLATGELLRLQDGGILASTPERDRGRRLTAGKFSPDGSRFGGCVDRRYLVIWELPKNEYELPRELVRLRGQDPIQRFAFSHNGEYLAVGSEIVRFWKVEKAKPKLSLGAPMRVPDAAFSPHGSQLALITWKFSEGDPGASSFWNPSIIELRSMETAEIMRRFELPGEISWNVVRWLSGGDALVVGSEKSILVLSLSTWTVLDRVDLPDWSIRKLTVLSTDRLGMLAVPASDQKEVVRVWQWTSGRLVEENDHRVTAKDFQSPGIVETTRDTVSVKQPETAGSHRVVEHLRPVNSAMLSPDGRFLLTATGSLHDRRSLFFDGLVHLWDTEIGLPAASPQHFDRAVWFARFDPTGRWVIASDEGGWRIWDTGSPAALTPQELAETGEALCGWQLDLTSNTLVPVNQIERLQELAKRNPKNWIVQGVLNH